MKLKFAGKKYGIDISQVVENQNDVLYIDTELQVIESISVVSNEEGDKTIIRIENEEVIDDLIAALVAFKKMRDI